MKYFYLSTLTICLIAIFLIGCGTAKYEEGYETGFQQGYDKGWQEGFQAGVEEASAEITKDSRFTEEEICAKIWAKLPYELPDDYRIEQFDIKTRTAEYADDKKWKFEVYGSGEERITEPKTTEEKSEILWIERIKERVITYDLILQADYFESSGLLEITQIEELNKQSSLVTVSETPLQAKLLVKWYRVEYAGWDYHFEGQAINIGAIPLYDVRLKIEWHEFDTEQIVLTHEIPVYIAKIYGEQYAGLIPPEYNAHFEIAFKDKRDLGFDNMEFLTSSGEIIPHEVDFEFLKKQAGL